MTITEMLDYLRRFHNEENAVTPNWSNPELFALMQARANECLSIIGLQEAIDSTLTTTAGTNQYTTPSGVLRIRRLYVDNQPLKYVTWRQFEARQPQGTAPSGTPTEWSQFAGSLFLTPTPSTSSLVIKLFCEKQQSAITSTSSTIDVPEVFHYALADGILADMFAKDLNTAMVSHFGGKFENTHKPAMREFAKRRKRIGSPITVVDADSLVETEWGLV